MQTNSPRPPSPPVPRRRNSTVILVYGPPKESRDAWLTTPGAIRVLDVLGYAYRNGAYIGPLAIQLRGTKIVGVIGNGHWLEVEPGAMERGGRVKRLRNLSTGQEVYTGTNPFTGGWWK